MKRSLSISLFALFITSTSFSSTESPSSTKLLLCKGLIDSSLATASFYFAWQTLKIGSKDIQACYSEYVKKREEGNSVIGSLSDGSEWSAEALCPLAYTSLLYLTSYSAYKNGRSALQILKRLCARKTLQRNSSTAHLHPTTRTSATKKASSLST